MAQFDICEVITSRIIEQLQHGIIPWNKPWTGIQGGAISGATGRPYSLLNQMLLNRPGEYFTFKQVQDRGGRVRKGEKSSVVVFWKQVKVSEKMEDGETKEKLVPMLKYYHVFHIAQCEGLESREQEAAPTENRNGEDIITGYQDREGITIRYIKGDEASYSHLRDCITLPLREQFISSEEFYSTAFHEMTHSTGHHKRLNRIRATAHFGNEEYSKEELVAEIGSAVLMNCSGIETNKSVRNSAAYIQGWLRALNNDQRMIVQASGQASKAVEYILNIK